MKVRDDCKILSETWFLCNSALTEVFGVGIHRSHEGGGKEASCRPVCAEGLWETTRAWWCWRL